MSADVITLPGVEPADTMQISTDPEIVAFIQSLLAAAQLGTIRSVAIAFTKDDDGTGEPLVGSFYRRGLGDSIFKLLGVAHDLAYRVQTEGIDQNPRADDRGDKA